MIRIVSILRCSDTLFIENIEKLAVLRKLQVAIEGSKRLDLLVQRIIIFDALDLFVHKTLSYFGDRVQISMSCINLNQIGLVFAILLCK